MAARATVIIPTYGDARFARWAVQSVQRQLVTDLEICIICDGSPPEMVSFFQSMAQGDPRVQVFAFPKSPRTGEPYRDLVLRKTTGRVIGYCSHDDLWLEGHVAAMERGLADGSFVNSLHAEVRPRPRRGAGALFMNVWHVDLSVPSTVAAMVRGRNFFGLTFGAHTRAAYEALPEGWATTPPAEPFTDLCMWKKFLAHDPAGARTVRSITALGFPKPVRSDWSEQARDEELASYFEALGDGAFLRRVEAERRAFLGNLQAARALGWHYAGPWSTSLLTPRVAGVVKAVADFVEGLGRAR